MSPSAVQDRRSAGAAVSSSALRLLRLALVLATLPLGAQTPPAEDPPHDITKVDPAPLGGAIAVPLPESQARRLRRYNIEELAGSKQALGSQLVDGHLPFPLLDYRVQSGVVDQRISFFEGGLVVVRMSGAGGTIQKRVIIPSEAMKTYLDLAPVERLEQLGESGLSEPKDGRVAHLRVYVPKKLTFVERTFDPATRQPKILHDALMPLQDLLRAISEDRAVTSTLPNYDPRVGDELVADDRKTWRVERLIPNGDIVELRCTSGPLIMYVARKDLYNYFVGRSGQ